MTSDPFIIPAKPYSITEPPIAYQQGVDLSKRNTMALPSIAAYYAQPTTTSQLLAALQYARSQHLKPHILGGGSNSLPQLQVTSMVITPAMRAISCIHSHDTTVLISAGAGEPWDDFVQYSLQQGWFGLENLSLIPGTVGACPIQNIGAYGVEVKDRIEWVEAIHLDTGATHRFSNAECQFGYRDSIFKQQPNTWVIVTVVFKLSTVAQLVLDYGDLAAQVGDNPTPIDVARTVTAIRSSKIPSTALLPNAGSYFKNPLVPQAHADRLKQLHPSLPCYPAANGLCKIAAGWLIEHAGWKGKKLGNAGMYQHQALVMVNHGNASLADILATEAAVMADVQAQFGVQLEREPQIIY